MSSATQLQAVNQLMEAATPTHRISVTMASAGLLIPTRKYVWAALSALAAVRKDGAEVHQTTVA